MNLTPRRWHQSDMTHLARAPFRLDWTGPTLISSAVEWILAFRDLNNTHARIVALDGRLNFAERALTALEIKLDVDADSLGRIPHCGPLIVVANHPFGGLDGLAALALIKRRRPDVKILANHLLNRIPETHEDCFFVDPFGRTRSVAVVRAAIKHVKSGGALAIFPAGEVSSLKLRDREVADIAWNASIGSIVRSTGASVLPMFFGGRNSDAFQLAGLISPRLRTLMLPRELLKKRGTTIDVEIGNAIPQAKLRKFPTDEELAAYLRVRTYLLAGRAPNTATPGCGHQCGDAVAGAESPVQIESEVASLPADQTLAATGSLRVIFARSNQIPATLREIGRLREITFRAVGEGTSKARDLDQFDESYLHLFVWDASESLIVGSYRMGLTDEVLKQAGKFGLYTHSLFNFRDELLAQVSPAIELGRSFVRAEYQKEYVPLMLLWKGIATFVARNPKYKNLFGTVSISNDYRSFTKQLLIEFLKINTPANEDLQRLIAPKNPPRFGLGRSWATKLAATIVRGLDGIDELVGEIESDRCGMPVLLRQYLKLNARLLGFNVDPAFGDCVDGLMLVDLTQVSPAVLTRYMGREQATAFFAYHNRL